jgi:hypothetical protein
MDSYYRPDRNIYDTNPEDLYNSAPIVRQSKEKKITRKPIRKDDTCNLGSMPVPRNPLKGNSLTGYVGTNKMPTYDSIHSLEQDIDCLFAPDCAPANSSNKVDESYAKDDYHPPVAKTDSLIVNNIKEKKTQEYVEEHMLIIDSGDRNTVKFPNPFDYRVYFNTQYDDANIQRVFENVKSISLETAVLPDKYYFTKVNGTLEVDDDTTIKNLTDADRNTSFTCTSSDVSGTFVVIDVNDIIVSTTGTRKIKFAVETEYPTTITKNFEYIFTYDAPSGTVPIDVHSSSPSYPANIQIYEVQTFSLMKNKFNLLNIDEFSYVNEFSTNDVLAKSFAVLFMDSKCNDAHYAKTKMKGKEYNNDSLGTVNRLSIRLCDHTGIQLKNSYGNYIDYEVPKSRLCTCYTDSNGVFQRDYRCSCSYFRHPYYHPFQNTLIFKVITWEQSLNQEIF